MSSEKESKANPAAKQLRYTVLPDRMPRIPADKLNAEQAAAAAAIAEGPRGGVRGPFLPLMRSPGLADPVQKVGAYIRFGCELDKRINEMAALMAARHWTQQYEWAGHMPQALKAGLRQSIVDAIAGGWRPEEMAEDEQITYDLITELFTNKSVSDRIYARATTCFGEKGVVDLLGVAGYYSMLAMIMNVARTELKNDQPLPLDPMPQQIRRES